MRRLAGALAVVAALVVLVVAVVAWRHSDDEALVGLTAGSEDAKPGYARRTRVGPASPGEPMGAAVAGAAEQSEIRGPEAQVDASAAIDPRLARLRIVEQQVGGAEPAPSEMDAGPTHTMVMRVTGGLRLDSASGRKLGYKGDMTVRFPTAVGSPTNGRATFGAGDEVTSLFTYTRDEKDNYCIHEETHSKRGSTKFDGVAYNGDWCFVDGQYGHLDLAGHRGSADDIAAISHERQGQRFEPLVMQTLRELVADNEPLIRFDPMANDPGQTGSEAYGILPLPPEARQSPTEVKRLTGDVRFSSADGTLQSASLSGDVVLKSGTMSGAPLSFAARIVALPQDQIPAVRLP